jgi:hypothetical protein
MHLLPADPAQSPHPPLTNLGDEICKTVARLFAYLGTLALIAMLAVQGLDRAQAMLSEQQLPNLGWTAGRASLPATPAQPYFKGKSVAYTDIGHPLAPSSATAGLAHESRVGAVTSAASEDWMTGPEKPQLRGTL